LQKSVGDVWSRISSANALQKERSGSSERGPRSGRRSAGDTVGRRLERNVRRESASPVKTGEVRRKTQGGERSPSSASSSPKAVRRSRDRGCNGHRILRRAPTDRRHSGSSRGVPFHEGALTVVSAVSASSDPCETFQKKDARRDCSVPERGRGVRVNGARDRGVRGSVASTPWEENAHARVGRP